MIDTHTLKNGYEEISPPLLASESTMFGPRTTMAIATTIKTSNQPIVGMRFTLCYLYY